MNLQNIAQTKDYIYFKSNIFFVLGLYKSQDLNRGVITAEINVSNTNEKRDLLNRYQWNGISKNVPSNSRLNLIFRYLNYSVLNMIVHFFCDFYLNKYSFAWFYSCNET